jgi:hypothetical protein
VTREAFRSWSRPLQWLNRSANPLATKHLVWPVTRCLFHGHTSGRHQSRPLNPSWHDRKINRSRSTFRTSARSGKRLGARTGRERSRRIGVAASTGTVRGGVTPPTEVSPRSGHALSRRVRCGPLSRRWTAPAAVDGFARRDPDRRSARHARWREASHLRRRQLGFRPTPPVRQDQTTWPYGGSL